MSYPRSPRWQRSIHLADSRDYSEVAAIRGLRRVPETYTPRVRFLSDETRCFPTCDANPSLQSCGGQPQKLGCFSGEFPTGPLIRMADRVVDHGAHGHSSRFKLNPNSSHAQGEGDSEAIIRTKALKRGVLALPGTVFLPNERKTSYVRAALSLPRKDLVEEAVKRPRQAILDAPEATTAAEDFKTSFGTVYKSSSSRRRGIYEISPDVH